MSSKISTTSWGSSLINFLLFEKTITSQLRKVYINDPNRSEKLTSLYQLSKQYPALAKKFQNILKKKNTLKKQLSLEEFEQLKLFLINEKRAKEVQGSNLHTSKQVLPTKQLNIDEWQNSIIQMETIPTLPIIKTLPFESSNLLQKSDYLAEFLHSLVCLRISGPFIDQLYYKLNKHQSPEESSLSILIIQLFGSLLDDKEEYHHFDIQRKKILSFFDWVKCIWAEPISPQHDFLDQLNSRVKDSKPDRVNKCIAKSFKLLN